MNLAIPAEYEPGPVMAPVIRALRRARSGRGGVAVLDAAPAGFTRLLNSVLWDLGMRVAVHHADPGRPGRPFAVLDALLAAVDVAVPLVRGPCDRADPRLGLSRLPRYSVALFAQIDALLTVIREAAEENPLAFLVYNWEASDEASIAAFEKLAVFARCSPFVMFLL